jgi:hypothetical protein
MNASTLATWYDPLQVCMINTSNVNAPNTYGDILKNCAKAGALGQFGNGFFTLPSSAFSQKNREICCTEEKYLGERGFDEVIQGFEDGRTKVAVDVLMTLSSQNRSIAFLGDSMNTQLFTAFLEEVERELGSGDTFEYHAQPWWFINKAYYNLGFSDKVMSMILNIVKWTPPPLQNGFQGSSVYLYNINMYYFAFMDYEEATVAKNLIPFLCTKFHNDGMVILTNIGLHLETERIARDRVPMNEKISTLFTWFRDLRILNPKNIVAFRETTPTHFDSPARDGSYEKWHHSIRATYNYLMPNKWDHSLYYCRDIEKENNMTHFYNTLENDVAHRVMESWGPDAGFYILNVFKYLAPFYKLKYGHCGKFGRLNVIDCVHYCANAPQIWAPIWYELMNIIRNASSLLDAGVSFDTNLKLSWKNDNKWNDSQVIVSIDENDELYLKRYGLRHPVNGWNDIETLLQRTFPKIPSKSMTMEQMKENSEILYLKLDAVNSIPLGSVVKIPRKFNEYQLIRLGVSREIFCIVNGSKHSIPDWDTLVNMGLNMKTLQNLGLEEFDSIPLGDPLPMKH